jgi:hypothetical protein
VATFANPETTSASTSLAILSTPALAGSILTGFEAYDSSGNVLTGTMKDIPALNLSQSFSGPGYVESVTGLISSQVCSSALFLGTPGTAVCLSGNLSTPALAGQVIAGAQFFDNSGTVHTGTMPIGSSVTGANAVAVITIPAGFYDGTKTTTASDTNLTAANIKSGTSIFGVAGSLAAAFASCTDNALNASQCSTAVNRYVTATAGSSVTGTNGSLSATIPEGFYSGSQTATMADTNLVATNIKSGTTVFGVTGTLATAYANCTDNALNASQCSTAASRYVASAAGSAVNGTNGALTATIPQGFYDGTESCTMADTNLVATNILSGSTIFGVAGTAGFPSIAASDMFRDPSTAQMTLATEESTSTYAAGYRDVPDANKDDDGYDGSSPITKASGPTVDCGTSQATVAGRIADCATQNGSNATWDGKANGTTGEALWTLVTRLNGSEVWRDGAQVRFGLDSSRHPGCRSPGRQTG